uniref:Alcohol dehydrogenase-like N-terminal domain-containing protein n=1 Tax=Timema genevievae TaxID=629358 RepID=A0A7R9K0T5_TIMGE|nr:unnamed protein product [Timema genevievae]
MISKRASQISMVASSLDHLVYEKRPIEFISIFFTVSPWTVHHHHPLHSLAIDCPSSPPSSQSHHRLSIITTLFTYPTWPTHAATSDHMRTFFTEVWSGQSVANLREGVERLYLWLADQVEEVKRLAEELIQPRRFLRQIQHLLENDLSRTGLYFGGLGFLFGSLFGVMLGLSWYRPPPPMQRMRAVVCTGYYGPDSLATVEDMPVPTISSPDQILVQVKAASVDTVDSKICYGYGRVLRKQLYKYSYVSIVACLQYKNVTVLIRKQDVENAKRHFNFPVILGRDCSGIIIEIGQKVKNFEFGDEVWFGAPFWSSGMMCECVVVKENMVAKKPRGVGFEVAASLPYTGTVAWNAMVHQAGLNEASTAGKR